MHRLVLLTVLLTLQPVSAFAKDEADEDYPPGLLARYTSGENSVERVDPDVQFVWCSHVPDARLPAKPFEARWTGQVLVRAAGKYQFHLFAHGEATIHVNGKEVARGKRESAGWIDGTEQTLDFGEQKLEITFRKTEPQAQIKVYWSSDSFLLEPIPPQVLFQSKPRPDLQRVERGRDVYEAHRCNRCHARANESPSPAAPDLAQVALGLNREWLAEWLVKPQGQTPHARMPEFGFTKVEADAVAAFLASLSADQRLPAVDATDRAHAARQGEVHFRSLGCLACHSQGKHSTTSMTNGGDLTSINRKRTAAWIAAWLSEPDKLNPDHRMPVVKLTADERRQLALFLAGDEGRSPAFSEKPGFSTAPRVIAEGRRLVAAARCAACHRILDVTANIATLPALEKPVADWSKSCLADGANRANWRPGYSVSKDDREAVVAFVKTRHGPLAPESPFAYGARLLRQKNCLACHERDGSQGIAAIAGKMAKLDADLQGQSEALIPPDLTAVGDKLHDSALATAISGEQPQVRMPWLRVRMPRFQHSPAEKEAILAYLIGHDRIPEYDARDRESVAAAPPAPAADDSPDVKDKKDRERKKYHDAGRQLVGSKGFSCAACHRVGQFEPRNVALGTRGSDLYLLGDRMRREYFLRWTRSPLRIIPGMEMPSYEKPVAKLLDGKIDTQLAALWDALNDPKSPIPVDGTLLEQVLTVGPGEPAKIIRDVFNIGAVEKPEFVARSFAIGMNNRTNLLIDLETMTLRHQWYGDFARQCAVGKSWYWEPGPVGPANVHRLSLVRGVTSPDVHLCRVGEPEKPFLATSRSGAPVRLTRYTAKKDGVELTFRLEFSLPVPGRQAWVYVSEEFAPITSDPHSAAPGFRRAVRVGTVPIGFEPWLRVLPDSGNSAVRPNSETVNFHSMHKPEFSSEFVRTDRLSWTQTEAAAVLKSDQGTNPVSTIQLEAVTSVPGFDGIRLPLDRKIMPTAITWLPDGTLAFCSLKGQVYLAKDTDGDGVEDRLTLIEEGLAAPYGLIAIGNELIVAHKPELLRLRDDNGDGRADVRHVVATGWGYSDNYHDWTHGIVRDSRGNLYVGISSDYAQPGRKEETTKWRGKILRIDPNGNITPVASGFRYPTGLAITPDNQVFISDNQGVQNTFNEINHLVEGGRYGVPSLYDEKTSEPPRNPAIQLPHPWTRSVNGIFFLPARGRGGEEEKRRGGEHPFAGHGIGCEYDSKFLVRFTLQKVGDTYQGAVYPFSLPPVKDGPDQFLGTLCGGVSPSGDIYIGSIIDSGWLGGANVGDIVRLRPNGKLPLGIRELRAGPGEFRIDFTAPVDKTAAARPENYDISGYTRKWQGAYATPDSGRHKLAVKSVRVAEDGLWVVVQVDPQLENHVYDVTCGRIGSDPKVALWPATGHYTMNRVPESSSR